MSAMSATKPRYHHGNLHAALVEAAFELARTGGPEAVVVREASRRVGVSHNAAYRHFPDREALLRAVGQRCMEELAALMQRLIVEVGPADDSVQAALGRLRATGMAYVQFALNEPGLFRTGFVSVGHLQPGDSTAEGLAPSPSPLEILKQQLDGLVAAGGMDPEARSYAEFAAWSSVHGFSMLLLEGPLRDMAELERDAALERTLRTVERGLMAGR